jgi:acetolactate synthase-1/2/3 large subunit
MMRVADYIIERLWLECVRNIYMVTGRGMLHLSDAVARHGQMRNVCTHHEQAAAFAAVGEAQYSGRMGACLVSTGCAATNTITGVLNAWQDGTPCIFVSGQNQLAETVRHTGLSLRTFGSQETDIIRIVESITNFAAMITDPKMIAYEMDRAIHCANNGRKGPVFVDVPLDIQAMRVEPDELERFEPESIATPPKREDVDFVADALREAERPVVLVGSGVRSGDAIDDLKSLVETFSLPLVFATSAVDTYGSGHELSIGAVGTIGGTRSGNFAVQNADLVLVLGCRLSPVTTGSDPAKFARAARVVVVDIDPAEHAKSTVRVDRLIAADVKEFLAALRSSQLNSAPKKWVETCRHWKRLFPKCEDTRKQSEKVDLYHLAERLTEVLPDDAVLLTDTGLEEIIVPSSVDFRAGQRCLHPWSQGSMGFALPAAVGAHFACGGPVVAVIGDGSVMMNLQELQTVVHHDVPLKLLIINNNAYAVIRKRQLDLYRTRTIGTDPTNGVSCPDFSKLAECFGLPYVRIDGSEQLEQGLKQVLGMDSAVLCEIMGLEDQEYLRTSYAFNSKRRLVRRPMEDLEPFLDREVFLAEMIVEPIDQ